MFVLPADCVSLLETTTPARFGATAVRTVLVGMLPAHRSALESSKVLVYGVYYNVTSSWSGVVGLGEIEPVVATPVVRL